MSTGFTPFANQKETFIITKETYKKYNLKTWGENFKLGTAGYRDLLDSNDMFSPEVPFNAVTMAILAEARANVAIKHKLTDLHIGGEVRPHTQKFINLFSRIYAAKNIKVHLRRENGTTPIWLSSFGVFYYGLSGGENFTASHSPGFKGGWKPMNDKGMQLLDMATEIANEVKSVIRNIEKSELKIELASSDSELILHDFEPVPAYTELIKNLIPAESFEKIRSAFNNGFKLGVCTEGGSMGAAASDIFSELDFPVNSRIKFYYKEESSDYHGIGVLDGVNHGVDPGKWQVYKNVGAQELLKNNEVDLYFIWDPDGDRFNIITSAPAGFETEALEAGLETEKLNDSKIAVYFKPNQIYFMLTALRIKNLKESGTPWIVAITYPTSRSITEVAEAAGRKYNVNVKTVKVPVGFKHFGNMTTIIENSIKSNTEAVFTDVTGNKHNFGENPGIAIMAEESGGAAMGTINPLYNMDKTGFSIALKEKDGMQIGITVMALASELFEQNKSFAEYYTELLHEYRIKYRYYERQDIMLYDESLRGEERKKAQLRGNELKNKIVDFFRNLTGADLDTATSALFKASGGSFDLKIKNAFWAGDGTVLEFENYWFEIRASGTDAVLRYYMEGEDKNRLHELNTSLTKLNI